MQGPGPVPAGTAESGLCPRGAVDGMKRQRIFDHVTAPAPRYLMRLALIEQLLDLLPAPPTRFAEIGPGMGDLSLYLAGRFTDSKGILFEYSPQGAQLLGKRCAGHVQLEVREQDLLQLDDSFEFDLIAACEVLEHMEDDEGALRKISAMLNNSGHFLFSAPSYMRRWQRGDDYAGHVRRYERQEIDDKFSTAGLTIVHCWMYGFPVTQATYPVRQLYYSMLQKQRIRTRDEATKSSGIERSLASRLNTRFMTVLLKPFFLMQSAVRNTSLGDGFLVLARKAANP